MPRDPSQWNTAKGESKLNEVADEVIAAFREGQSLRAIGRTYSMSPTGIQKWLRAQGEYKETSVCGLPECDVEFPYRPKKLYCTNLHARRANARDRALTEEEQEKIRIRRRMIQAIRNGTVKRPDTCERCGGSPKPAKDGRSLIQADHHHGYSDETALDIWWLCKPCDVAVEKLRKKGKTVNRETPRLGEGEAPASTQLLTLEGEKRSLNEWAEICGVTRGALLLRLKRGWSLEDAATRQMRRR